MSAQSQPGPRASVWSMPLSMMQSPPSTLHTVRKGVRDQRAPSCAVARMSYNWSPKLAEAGGKRGAHVSVLGFKVELVLVASIAKNVQITCGNGGRVAQCRSALRFGRSLVE